MLMIIICVCALLLCGTVIQGNLCILLHITLIGWIPATI